MVFSPSLPECTQRRRADLEQVPADLEQVQWCGASASGAGAGAGGAKCRCRCSSCVCSSWRRSSRCRRGSSWNCGPGAATLAVVGVGSFVAAVSDATDSDSPDAGTIVPAPDSGGAGIDDGGATDEGTTDEGTTDEGTTDEGTTEKVLLTKAP